MSADAAVLQAILARLTEIEAAIASGGAGAGAAAPPAGDALSRLANDLDLSVLQTKGAALVKAAEALPGAEAATLVSSPPTPCAPRAVPRVPRAALAATPLDRRFAF